MECSPLPGPGQGRADRVYVGADDGAEAAEEFLGLAALCFVWYPGGSLAGVVVLVSDVRASEFA